MVRFRGSGKHSVDEGTDRRRAGSHEHFLIFLGESLIFSSQAAERSININGPSCDSISLAICFDSSFVDHFSQFITMIT